MKTLLGAAFALLAASIPATASPAPTEESRKLFIGRYGELIRYSVGVKVDPFMLGEAEVVHFQGDAGLKRSDFTPANFKKHKLEQLTVYPKTARGGASLSQLRKEKPAEYAAAGLTFKLNDEPYPHEPHSWPEGSFTIYIRAPYELMEYYTETEGHVFILRSASPIDDVWRSLRDHVMPPEKRERLNSEGTPRSLNGRLLVEPAFFKGFLLPLLVLLFGAFLGGVPSSARVVRFRFVLACAAAVAGVSAFAGLIGDFILALKTPPYHSLALYALAPLAVAACARRFGLPLGRLRWIPITLWCMLHGLMGFDAALLVRRLFSGSADALNGLCYGFQIGLIAAVIHLFSGWLGGFRRKSA